MELLYNSEAFVVMQFTLVGETALTLSKGQGAEVLVFDLQA